MFIAVSTIKKRFPAVGTFGSYMFSFRSLVYVFDVPSQIGRFREDAIAERASWTSSIANVHFMARSIHEIL